MQRRDVLIADDDRLLCALVASAFRANGCDPRCVHDGNEALAALRVRQPDLLVLDANMPVRDGYAVLEALQGVPAPPVLMLTAMRGASDVARARALGVAGYVAKPFTAPVLLKRAFAILAARTPQPVSPPPPAALAAHDAPEWMID